jgi:hypothetical protein
VDPRLLMLGLALLLLILAVVYLVATVVSARRERHLGAGRKGDAEIVPITASDAPIELGGWVPSTEPDERGLRIGTGFEDIAPGTVHGQDRPTRHEVVDVEPGATLLSIEELIRRHAETPMPERAPMPGAPIETLLHPRGAEVPGGAGPVGAQVVKVPEPLDSPRVPAEDPTPAARPWSAPSVPVIPVSEAPSPAPAPVLAPDAAARSMEAAVTVALATVPDPPAAPERVMAEPAPVSAPSPTELPQVALVPEPEPEPEPDPLLLLESLLAEPAVAAAPGTPQREATPASPSPTTAVAVRPTARDVRQVPAYRMVAPIELWFADGPPRVGIRPGTPTYLKYQRLAQVLLNDLKEAHGQG